MKRLLTLLLSLAPLSALAADPAGSVLLSLGNNSAIDQQGASRALAPC